ncbi:DNA sulfur modification protein DndB [Solibacillus sp. FSL K6-1523]|uniref:DNA sulfur modification protein DndB n=1 Tax=Solibacillus sp. FSL K6-1523 TaxID=2921471 RepID=UPI0030F5F48B
MNNKFYFAGIPYKQFGHELFFTQMSLKTLLAVVDVDANVQRELDIQRRHEIRAFILNNLEQGHDFYFSPFVFSARGEIEQDGQGYSLTPGSKLFISDGQHRLYALESALIMLKSSLSAAEYIRNEEKVIELKRQIEFLENFPIAMQIYLQLNVQQERQMFVDLNTERREAHPGQLLQYDHRDTYSILTRKVAQNLKDKMDIEVKSARALKSSSSITTLVMMKRCLVALFNGTFTLKSGEINFQYPQYEVEHIAETFFLKWLEIFPKHAHNRFKYVAGLTGIQIALALTVNYLMKEHRISHLEAIELLSHLKKFSWLHTHPIFAFLYSQEKKCIAGHSSSYAVRRLKNEFVELIHQEMAVKK